MNQRLGLEHNKMNVGKLLRLYREHAKYKSEYVAKELAISAGTYSKMEKGIIELTDSRLFLICKIYDITPPEFYLHFFGRCRCYHLQHSCRLFLFNKTNNGRKKELNKEFISKRE